MMEYKDFGFSSAQSTHMHKVFMPVLLSACGPLPPGTRVLDIGCGNGYTAGMLLEKGCRVVGTDPGQKGIDIARSHYPDGRFESLPADADLLEQLKEQPFDLVVSTEVVEHLYAPRPFVQGAYAALKPGGLFVCTTPYHGYLKNLMLSVLNRWDHHADPLWDGGHIKLWSWKSLSKLLQEAGFVDIKFKGAGRLPYLWMTMVVSGRKPNP